MGEPGTSCEVTANLFDFSAIAVQLKFCRFFVHGLMGLEGLVHLCNDECSLCSNAALLSRTQARLCIARLNLSRFADV